MFFVVLLSLIQSAGAVSFVPKLLYHFGSFEPLMKDVAARTVPEADWRRYIMGDETRFGQKIYRRGLYATSHPGFSSYFGDRLLEAESIRAPWMIRISVKEECRNEAPINLATLYQDARVIRVLRQFRDPAFPNAKIFHDRCYHLDDDTEEEIADFEMVTGVAQPTACEAMADRIFRALKPKIAVDSIWHQSWYIRDRNCIERIDGTAAQNLKWMRDIPGYWMERPNGDYERKWNYFKNSSLALILVRALIEAPAMNETTLADLRAMTKKSDLVNPASTWRGLQSNWFARILPAWMAEYSRCRDLQRLADWKQAARVKYDEWLGAENASALEESMENTAEHSFCQ